jgi:hypothetical protein
LLRHAICTPLLSSARVVSVNVVAVAGNTAIAILSAPVPVSVTVVVAVRLILKNASRVV